MTNGFQFNKHKKRKEKNPQRYKTNFFMSLVRIMVKTAALINHQDTADIFFNQWASSSDQCVNVLRSSGQQARCSRDQAWNHSADLKFFK